MLASPTTINLVSRIQANQFVYWKRLRMPWRIFPQIVVDGIVEEEGLEILELGAGIMEKGLDQIDIRIHRPSSIVDGEDDLKPVFEASIEHNLYLATILHGLINGLINIHPVLGTERAPCFSVSLRLRPSGIGSEDLPGNSHDTSGPWPL